MMHNLTDLFDRTLENLNEETSENNQNDMNMFSFLRITYSKMASPNGAKNISIICRYRLNVVSLSGW